MDRLLKQVRTPVPGTTVVLYGFVPAGDAQREALMHAVVLSFDGWTALLSVWVDNCLSGGVIHVGLALALPRDNAWWFGTLALHELIYK